MSVTLHTTHGDLKVEVFCATVPKAAYNFLALCASGRYDDTYFHRNIASFMIQGGSPDPTGKGKGGDSVYGEQFEDEFRSSLRHNARGILSMANKGPATNGSQFFICYKPAPHLDGKNTVFGKVLEGVDTTLDALEDVEVDKKSRPKEPVKIVSITMHANPLADE
ncbi:MAG: Peptidyl-prolyl cis-trans isomerase cyp10 [Alyxoria varia]|nr:MAG: Peptidyl-prolyl cis-trans isomerase cyp10 [Alyxoria varia]